MYHQLASKLVLTAGQTEYSQAIPTEGLNTAGIEFTVLSGGGTVAATIEESNDLENWVSNAGTAPSAAATSTTSPEYILSSTATGATTVAAAYIRVKWAENSGAGSVALAGGVNLSNQ